MFCFASSACVTNDDSACIQQFIYQGKTYDGCTTDGNSAFNSRPWCPTSLVDGEFLDSSDDYGWCDMTNCALSNAICFFWF